MPHRTTTALKIVDGALHILMEEGYGDLSMRKVADRVGISVGNLTYHFPTKQGLLHGVIRQGFGLLESRLEASMATEGSPVEMLTDAVTFVIEWGSEEDMSRFQREAWALASGDPVVSNIIGRFYENCAGFLRALFLAVNPKASEDQLRNAVVAFGLASEGTVILNSRLYDFWAPTEQVIKITMAHVLSILEVEQVEED